MDPLRNDVRKLVDSCNSIILERDDIIKILNGRVDEVITRHRNEDDTFSRVVADEKRLATARLDMADDGVIDNQQYTKEFATQIITAFNQEYHKKAVKNIEDLRKKKSKASKEMVKDYDDSLALVNELKKQFNL